MRWMAAVGLAAAVACSSSTQTGGGTTSTSATGGATTGTTSAGGTAAGGGGAGGASGCPSAVLCGDQGTCCDQGEECVDGACLPECPSGVRCAEACCGEGDLCLAKTCVTPTTPCQDSVDCAPDELCEPTLELCVPDLGGDDKCQVIDPPSPFVPSPKWSWTGSTTLPAFDQGISAPLVADIDKDGVPDVIGGTTDESNGAPTGVLRALNGLTGKDKWAPAADAFDPQNRIDPRTVGALADLDGDKTIDIVALGADGRVMAFDPTGKLLWKSTKPDKSPYAYALRRSSISVADMDADGKGEIVIGGVVLAHDGVLLSGEGRDDHGGLPYNGSGAVYGTHSIVADVDEDGKQDVVVGHAVYRLDGSTLWDNGLGERGLPAIADLDNDGKPELVVSGAAAALRVLDAKTGKLLHSLAAGGNNAGPPVLADFDGDGVLEIGVHRDKPCDYRVYEYDPQAGLSPKWTAAQTVCSGFFAATAFDFDGDGSVEVVTHDDCYIIILSGADGKELLKIEAPHSTWSEFVSIADVDGDGSADLLFSTNDHYFLAHPTYCPYAPSKLTHGYFAYHDPKGSWMPTRRIWNQQPYHITNIKIDGALPRPELPSWGKGGYNDYRVSAQGKGAGNAPDLVVSLAASLIKCPSTVVLEATVSNKGSLGVKSGVVVSFYEGVAPGGTYLGSATTKKPLLPGAGEKLSLDAPAPKGSLPGSYYAKVDSDASDLGAVAECLEDNNTASVQNVSCDKLY